MGLNILAIGLIIQNLETLAHPAITFAWVAALLVVVGSVLILLGNRVLNRA